MNSFLNNNLKLFNNRFPSLYKKILPIIPTFSIDLIPDLEIMQTKKGLNTAKYKGVFLHSKYNPVGESQKLAASKNILDAETIVFYGFALGYLPNACASLYPKKNIVLIEPDPLWLLLAFSLVDWTPILTQRSCGFFLQAPQNAIITVLEHFGLKNCAHINLETQKAHNRNYFLQIQELIKRNEQKQDINNATLDKFSYLWLRNLCRNIQNDISKYGGICKYQNCMRVSNPSKENDSTSIPALVLAAGPSLEKILPHLCELKKRCVIVCVDTALKACLSVGVQPHFIILIDPQYWNARHLDWLEAPESILVTESAAYPSVFRFKSKETILCTSLFPLGQYIEEYTGKNGSLVAGGSVASSAWEFARYIGCTTIFTAGLDLGFPKKQTHIKGSTFEEQTIRISNRLKNAETMNAHSFNNVTVCEKKNFAGDTILTDSRMNMYAWWFESKCAQYTEIHTKTLTKESLAIPGIQVTSVENVLLLPAQNTMIEKLLYSIPPETDQICRLRHTKLNTALADLQISFQKLTKLTNTAITICDTLLLQLEKKHDVTHINTAFLKLESLDLQIKNSKVASLAALVFPSNKKLAKIYKKLGLLESFNKENEYVQACIQSFKQSKIMYCEIIQSINIHSLLLFSQVLNYKSDNYTVRICRKKSANS